MPRLGDEGTQPQPGSEPEPIATVPEPTADIQQSQQMQELTQTLNDLMGQLDRLPPEISVDEAIQYALSQAANDALLSRQALKQQQQILLLREHLRELYKHREAQETHLQEAWERLREAETQVEEARKAFIREQQVQGPWSPPPS
jgi:hypothetical protein